MEKTEQRHDTFFQRTAPEGPETQNSKPETLSCLIFAPGKYFSLKQPQQAERRSIMKIMKFGGTSVGKPERMHQVAELITKDAEPKIVVLSALSGTTNALVSIGDAMAAGDRETAKQQIEKLDAHYQSFIRELLKTEATLDKAKQIVAEHF